MKKIIYQAPGLAAHFKCAAKPGTTLSEVLVSTLVMSIGVVALASLFPISVLRSIQASQLTNAAILRYNAEAQIKTIPELLNIGEEWQPAYSYQANDVAVASSEVRTKSPAAVFVRADTAQSGGAEPLWNFREGGGTEDPTGSGSTNWTTVRLRNYVIDPLGYLLVDPTDGDGRFRQGNGGALSGAQQHFGNVGGNAFHQFVNRFPAFGLFRGSDSAALNEWRAANACILPDSWTLQAESLDLSYSTGNQFVELIGVDGNALATAVQYSAPDLVPDRIVLYDSTGKYSVTYPITSTPTAGTLGAQISWAPAPALSFTPVRARVESLERRYSYLLSVRRGTSSAAHTDVVVFFRRSYSVQDEQVYSCIFRKIDRGDDTAPGFGGVDDNNNGTTDGRDTAELGWNGSDDKPRNFVIVQYSSSGNKPFYKKGGYICDANNLRWYRIVDVVEPLLALTQTQQISNITPGGYELDPVAPNCDRAVKLTLEKAIVEDSPMDIANGNPFTAVINNGIQGGAILMRGVVDVFPLRARQPWEE